MCACVCVLSLHAASLVGLMISLPVFAEVCGYQCACHHSCNVLAVCGCHCFFGGEAGSLMGGWITHTHTIYSSHAHVCKQHKAYVPITIPPPNAHTHRCASSTARSGCWVWAWACGCWPACAAGWPPASPRSSSAVPLWGWARRPLWPWRRPS